MTIDLGAYSYHQESRNPTKCKACHSKSLRDHLFVSDLNSYMTYDNSRMKVEPRTYICIYIYIYIYIREIFPFKPTAPPQPAVCMIALESIREYMMYDVITL